MRDWLKNNIMSTLTLGAIIGAAYYSNELRQLMFSTPEKKYETESHIEQKPNDVDVYKQSVSLDSTLKVFLANERENIQRDSIRLDKVDRNTDQIFLLKKVITQQDSLLKAYINIHN